MAITVTAAAQTGRRVAVTVAGLSTATPAVSSLTLYRDDLDQPRTPVRGFLDYVPTSDGFVAFDNEAPLERPVFYTLRTVRADGSIVEQTTAAPVMLDASYPAISEPVTGQSVEVAAIVSWPTIERAGRAAVVDVVDRADPLVVSQGLSSPSSALTLRTDTIVARRALRDLLETAQVLQVRDPHPDVEDAYVVPGKVAEKRLTMDPTDPRREIVLDVRHVGAPAIGVASGGDTLQELADAFPTVGLVANTGFETNTTGYSGSNATLTRVTTQAHTGTASLSISATTAATAIAQDTGTGLSGIAVVAGRTYRVDSWHRPNTTARSVQHKVDWYNAAGTFLSTSTGTAAAEVAGTWTQLHDTFVAPVGAAFARRQVLVLTPAAGEIHYVDDFVLEAGTLADIASAFPGTLLDIASADLAAF